MTEANAHGRILFLLKSDGVGGVERKVGGLVERMAARGVVADVAALTRADGPRLLGHLDVRVLGSDRRPLVVSRLIQRHRLGRLVRAGHHDAIVSFGPNANAVACLLLRRHGTRIVITEVGNPTIPRRRKWNRWWMWTYRRADVLVALTDRARDHLASGWRRPGHLAVIPNPLSPLVPRSAPETERAPVVVGLGRLAASKRWGDLLEAFALLGPRADGWRIAFVGDGPERPALERHAEELGLAGRVDFAGWVESPWSLLTGSAVSAMPSAHEGFANALLEAIACGCAVVASDCEYGPREILDGDEASLHAVGDVAGLADRLGHLLDSRDVRIAAARRAQRALDRYDPERITTEWLRVCGLHVDAPIP